jgi:putative transposase
VIKGEKTLNEIASENSIIPKNLQNWKATFLANAELAMEPNKAVKEYKDENKELHAKIYEYVQE